MELCSPAFLSTLDAEAWVMREHSINSRLLRKVARESVSLDFATRLACRLGVSPPWHWAIEEESRLKDALLEAGHSDIATDRMAASQRWWGHVHVMLGIFALQNMGTGYSGVPAPAELLLRLSQMANYLERGIIPGPVSDVVAPRRARIGPEEERHLMIAAAYIAAVKSRRLLGRRPIKTIAQRYGVDRETARRWQKMPLSKHLRMILDNNPRFLIRLVKDAAKKYSMAGRSQKAVNARGGIAKSDRPHSKP